MRNPSLLPLGLFSAGRLVRVGSAAVRGPPPGISFRRSRRDPSSTPLFITEEETKL